MINDYARNTLGGSTPVHLASTSVLVKRYIRSIGVFFTRKSNGTPYECIIHVWHHHVCIRTSYLHSKLAAADSPLMSSWVLLPVSSPHGLASAAAYGLATQVGHKYMLKTSFGIQLDIPQAGYEYSWIMTSDPNAVSSQPEIEPETTKQETKDDWGRPE